MRDIIGNRSTRLTEITPLLLAVTVLVLGQLILVACEGRAYLEQSCLYAQKLLDGCVADGRGFTDCQESLPIELRDCPSDVQRETVRTGAAI